MTVGSVQEDEASKNAANSENQPLRLAAENVTVVSVQEDEASKNATNSEIHDLDSLFEPLGGFGKFQLFNMACITSIICLCMFSELGYVLTTAELKHRCLISECEGAEGSYGAEGATWLPAAIPTTSTGTYDSCRRYNASSLLCTNSSFSTTPYHCHDFIYETDEWTIHREDWGIHCDEETYMLNLVGSANNAGQVVGGFMVGYLQDRFGRKTALVSMTIAVSIVGIIKSFSVNYVMMVAMEVIETQVSVGLFNGPFVLALEIVAPSQRVLAGTIIAMAYPLGEMLLGLVQYLTFNWRTTIRICYAPFLITVTYFWILPESIRWLITQQRNEEAIAVIKKIARMNGKPYPEASVVNVINAEATKQNTPDASGNVIKEGYRDVWKSPKIRYRILAILLTRMSVLFVYFGMTMNSVSLTDDKFVNFILSGLIELPGYICVYFLMDRIGRKTSLWTNMVLCCVSCVLSAFTPIEWGVPKLLLFLLGKFGVSGALFVTDIYTAEMFPTFMRSTILSVSVLVGKLACVVAPQVPLLGNIYKPLPLLIFGSIALIGATVVVIFPETLNNNLPDTIEEAENLGRKHSHIRIANVDASKLPQV